MILDLTVLQQHTALQTHTVPDHHVGTDNHVGADAAVLPDLGRWVDHDVAAIDVGLGVRSEELGVAFGERGEVEAGAREEVLGLTDVHPEALQVKGVQLAVVADGGEGLLFDGGGAQLDAVQHTGVQDVDAGVDAVADELDGLLDEAVDARGVVGLVDDDTVLGGLVDLGDDDGALVAVVLVELSQLFEGEVADDIRVQHEERRVILAEDLLRQLQRTSRAQRFRLHGELNANIVLFLVLLESRHHHIGAVVDS